MKRSIFLMCATILLTACGNNNNPKIQIPYEEESVDYDYIPSYPEMGDTELFHPLNAFGICEDGKYWKTGVGIRFNNDVFGENYSINFMQADIKLPTAENIKLYPYNDKYDKQGSKPRYPAPFWYLGGQGNQILNKAGWALDLGLMYQNGEIKTYAQTHNLINNRTIMLYTKSNGLDYSFEPGSYLTTRIYFKKDGVLSLDIITHNKVIIRKNKSIVDSMPEISDKYEPHVIHIEIPNTGGKNSGEYLDSLNMINNHHEFFSFDKDMNNWGWNIIGKKGILGRPMKTNVTLAYNFSDKLSQSERDEIMLKAKDKIVGTVLFIQAGIVTDWDKDGFPIAGDINSDWNKGKNTVCSTDSVYTSKNQDGSRNIDIVMPGALQMCTKMTPGKQVKKFALSNNSSSQTCSGPPLPKLNAPDDLAISGIIGDPQGATGTFDLSNTATTFADSVSYTLTSPDLNLSLTSGTLAGGASQSVRVSKACTVPGMSGPFPVVISGEGAASKTVNVTVNCHCPTVKAVPTSLKGKVTTLMVATPTSCATPKPLAPKPIVPSAMTLMGVVGGEATGTTTIANGEAGDDLSTIGGMNALFNAENMTFNPAAMYLNAGNKQDFTAYKPCTVAGSTTQNITVSIDTDTHTEKTILATVNCGVPEFSASPKEFVELLGNQVDSSFTLTNTPMGAQPASLLPINYSTSGFSTGTLPSGQSIETKFSYLCETVGKHDVPVTLSGTVNYQGATVRLVDKTVTHTVNCLETPKVIAYSAAQLEGYFGQPVDGEFEISNSMTQHIPGVNGALEYVATSYGGSSTITAGASGQLAEGQHSKVAFTTICDKIGDKVITFTFSRPNEPYIAGMSVNEFQMTVKCKKPEPFQLTGNLDLHQGYDNAHPDTATLTFTNTMPFARDINFADGPASQVNPGVIHLPANGSATTTVSGLCNSYSAYVGPFNLNEHFVEYINDTLVNEAHVTGKLLCLTPINTDSEVLVTYALAAAQGACSYGYYQAGGYGVAANCLATVDDAKQWALSHLDEARQNFRNAHQGCATYDKCNFKETDWTLTADGTIYPNMFISGTVDINK